MPASNQQTTLRDCGYPQVGCYTLHGSLTSPYKAGFLTSASSLPFPFSYYVQWDNEKSLLCYSDRIAQDLHLIPSSDCYADNNLHFICSIWNYTDIIITRCQFAVNNPHNILSNFYHFMYSGKRSVLLLFFCGFFSVTEVFDVVIPLAPLNLAYLLLFTPFTAALLFFCICPILNYIFRPVFRQIQAKQPKEDFL